LHQLFDLGTVLLVGLGHVQGQQVAQRIYGELRVAAPFALGPS
jgi:hypothetical protein